MSNRPHYRSHKAYLARQNRRQEKNAGIGILCLFGFMALVNMGYQPAGAPQQPASVAPALIPVLPPPTTSQIDIQPQVTEDTEILDDAPQLSDRPSECSTDECIAGFKVYLSTGPNAAFAIATNGVWAWRGNEAHIGVAQAEAMSACVTAGGDACHLIASKQSSN